MIFNILLVVKKKTSAPFRSGGDAAGRPGGMCDRTPLLGSKMAMP